MLKTPFLYLRGFIGFLRKTPPKHLGLLLILTVASILVSVMVTSRYLGGSPLEKFAQVNGFQTYVESTNGQGIISITQDSVRLEAENKSFPKAFVYAAAGDFKWNFSATPLIASGSCYPIFFSVEWAQTHISVWAETGSGWYYNFNGDESSAQSNTSIGGFITIGSKYDIEIEWNEQITDIIATVSIKNETWYKEFTIKIPEVGLSPALSLQAWADYNAHVEVHYVQSVFLSDNLRFAEESYDATVASILISIVFTTMTTLVFASKLNGFSSFLKFPLKIEVLALYSIIKRMYNFLVSYAKENKTFIYLISFFAVLRIILAISMSAHWFDMYAFKAWCQVINDKGLLVIYPETVVLPPIHSIRPVYPYPPIIAYIFFLITQIFPTSVHVPQALPVLLKFPPILAELSLGWVTFTAVKRWRGYKTGLVAATLSMLNITNSSIWGQYESVVALFMVLAVWLVITEHIELGWLFAALAVATKSTALPFIPGLLIISAKKRRFFHTLLGIGIFSLTTIVVWAPFLFSGYSLNFVLWQSGFGLFSSRGAFTPASSEITKTTVSALNIWPVINLLKDRVLPGTSVLATVLDNEPNQFLFLSYYQLGILLFAIFYVVILYSLRKKANGQSLMEKFSLLMLVFYMLPTRMHERYMYFALALLPFAYGKTKYAKVFYGLLLTTFSINLLSALSGQWTPPDLLSHTTILCLTLVNISVLIIMLYRLIKEAK